MVTVRCLHKSIVGIRAIVEFLFYLTFLLITISINVIIFCQISYLNIFMFLTLWRVLQTLLNGANQWWRSMTVMSLTSNMEHNRSTISRLSKRIELVDVILGYPVKLIAWGTGL